MRRFTLFTVLYLAAGVCLSAIAIQQPDTTPSLKKVLLVNAGLLYLFAVLSTFQFWQPTISQSKLRDRSIWRQKLSAIVPWLLIAVAIFSCIFTALTAHLTTAVSAQAVSIILPCIERLLTRHQIPS